MPQALSAIAASLLLVLWLLRRSRPPLLPSVDASAVAALNRAQITLVRTSEPSTAEVSTPAREPGPLPASARQRRALALRLAAELRADTPRRRAAMQFCGRWGHAEALPWLRRGLRDPDPEVIRLAAAALAAFRRGGPAPRIPAVQALPLPLSLPRNVSRTR